MTNTSEICQCQIDSKLCDGTKDCLSGFDEENCLITKTTQTTMGETTNTPTQSLHLKTTTTRRVTNTGEMKTTSRIISQEITSETIKSNNQMI